MNVDDTALTYKIDVSLLPSLHQAHLQLVDQNVTLFLTVKIVPLSVTEAVISACLQLL